MDIRVFLNFVANNAEKIIGTTAALFFLTCIVLLVRSIANKDEEAGAGGAAIDVKEIEGAMRRVLSSQAVQVAGTAPAAAADGTGGDPAQLASLNEALRQREGTIEKLTQQLDKLRSEAASMPAGEGGDTTGLKAKLEELQARLAEYEIIEDDIADLSLFKEENARLKAEIEKLKSSLSAAPAASAPVAAAPAPPPPAPAAAPAAEKSQGFELDPNDDVMKEFAAAVSVQKAPPPKADTGIPTKPAEEDPQAAIDAMMAKMAAESEAGDAADPFAGALDVAPQAAADDPQAAIDAMLAAAEAEKAQADETAKQMNEKNAPPAANEEVSQDEIDKMLAGGLDEDPLAGTPDPDKMLSEVAALGLEADAGGDVLEESLDTDKLLAEVDDLKTPGQSSPAKKNAPKNDAPEVAPGDDLLAEFKADEGA